MALPLFVEHLFRKLLIHLLSYSLRPPLPSSCSGEVDRSLFYINPDNPKMNSISDIKSFKFSRQLSSHQRLE
jgi:hypothetical protein